MRAYGHAVSPRYRRIVIAAAELGVPLERVELDIAGGQNRTAEYLAKNPMGKIPTLEDDDGWTLWESFAILVYLGEKFPAKGLFPTELRARAEALRWCFWGASHLDPSVVGLFIQNVTNPMRGLAPDDAAIAGAHKELQRYLPLLESHLASRAWVLGDAFSLVDVGLGATCDGLFHPKLAFDRGPYPNLVAWHGRLVARPTWWRGP